MTSDPVDDEPILLCDQCRAKEGEIKDRLRKALGAAVKEAIHEPRLERDEEMRRKERERIVGIAPGDVLGRVAIRSGYLHLEPVFPFSAGALCESQAAHHEPVLVGRREHMRLTASAGQLGRIPVVDRLPALPTLGNPDWVELPLWACSTCWGKPAARSASHLHRRQRIARNELPWGCLMGDHFTKGDLTLCAVAGCSAVWERGAWVEAS